MDVKIRKASVGDFDAVYPLFEQLWPGKALDLEELKKVFNRGTASGNDVLLCLEENGDIKGFCAYAIVNNLWQEGQIAYIYAMVVDENCRGKGLGTALINEAVNTAKRQGMKRVELDSSFQRERAHKFYERLGFEKRAYLFSYAFKEQ